MERDAMLTVIPELADEDNDTCDDDVKVIECNDDDNDYISEDDGDEDLRSGSASGSGSNHCSDEEEEEDEDDNVGCSSRSISPAPTIQSITQSLYDSLSFTKHGRMVNATNPTYVMAADHSEVTVSCYILFPAGKSRMGLDSL